MKHRYNIAQKFCLAFLILLSFTASAQKLFKVDDFSDRFSAIVYYTDSEDGIVNGKINVFDNKINRAIIEADISAYFSNSDSTLSFNGDVLIYSDDYNFDGFTDIALYQGPFGNYSAAAYSIYLAKGDGFVYDEDFSSLGGYGFKVDTLNKQIISFESISGRQRVSEYEIKNNKPFLVYRYTKNGLTTGGVSVETYEVWNEEKKQLEKSETKYYEGTNSRILFFTLENERQQVVLYSADTENLNFVLCNTEENSSIVKVCYPDSFIYEQGYVGSRFTIDSRSSTTNLCFVTANNESYCIYESENEIGLVVVQNGESKQAKGNKSSQYGSLNLLMGNKYNNLKIANP